MYDDIEYMNLCTSYTDISGKTHQVKHSIINSSASQSDNDKSIGRALYLLFKDDEN